MPTIIGIKAMLDGCQADEIIAGVKGTVKKVLKQSTFGKGDKSGTLQPIIVRDDADEATEIKAKLWNHNPLNSDDVGRKIVFIAHQGQKGMTGLRLKEDTYDNKTSIILDVGDRAEVTFNDGAKAQRPQSESEPEPDDSDDDGLPFGGKPARATAPAPAPARPKAANGDGFTWKAVGAQMNRLGALYAAAFIQAQNKCAVEIEKQTGVKIPEDQIREVATTLFIEFNRKGYPLPDAPFTHYAEIPD